MAVRPVMKGDYMKKIDMKKIEMKKIYMKKIDIKKNYIFYFIALCLTAIFFVPSPVISSARAANPDATAASVQVTAKSAVLIDGDTGTILFEKDKDKELVPASITKIMTLTLIFDAIDRGKISLEDTVTVSEHAASMGGSQVFLEAGETQTVDTMIKCISIASANDAAVAMAEKIAGSEENFVNMMNDKAAELGMKHTQFKNCSGLDDDIKSGHYSSAYDVALMSRELIMKHPQISNYSTVWMDTITHHTKKGETEFGLTNTNKLVRFYEGITGLKTGSTSKAKYCLSATAARNGLNLIAVVMAAPDPKARFSEAQSLLDYGFANCTLYKDDLKKDVFPPVPVKNGSPSELTVIPKGTFSHTFIGDYDKNNVKKEIKYNTLTAPVPKGSQVGEIVYSYQGEKIGEIPLITTEEVQKSTYSDYLRAAFHKFFRLSL